MMDDPISCEKRPKKQKKKKLDLHETLEKIPEEFSSFQDLQKVCQDAADAFLSNIICDAVQLNKVNIDVERVKEDHDDISPVSADLESKNAVICTDEKERAGLLKPSVFIGKSKLYSSSLQIGQQWDRTKYNVVLLPDLSKVVYPDLGSFLDGKPKNNTEGNDFLLADSNRTVDRSSKPKPLIVVPQQPGPNNATYVAKNTVRFNLDSYKLNAQDDRFVDFEIGEIEFRVFMNPVVWDPVENFQLVVFRVGPQYHEEFFTGFGTTEGLIQAIKERAESLAKRQLQLAQTCLLTEFKDCKSFPLSTATLVIYGSSANIDWTQSKWKCVRFAINEAFYEENFNTCDLKCYEDLIEAIKRRAETILQQQRNLKDRMEGTTDAIIKEDEQAPAILLPKLENDADYKTNGFKRKFKSFRKWFKDAFSKKSHNCTSTSAHIRNGSTNSDVVRNDSSVSLPSSSVLFTDDSKNAKE